MAVSRASGKVSDEFTVPLCRGHHREVHRCGDEAAWWATAGVDPLGVANALWPPPTTTPSRPSSANWSCGWQAFSGNSAAPQPSKPVCSKFRLTICLSGKSAASLPIRGRSFMRSSVSPVRLRRRMIRRPEIAKSEAKKRRASLALTDAVVFARCFLQLANLPSFALDRLNRYEAALWRQVGQTLFALDALDRCKPHERRRSFWSGNWQKPPACRQDELGLT